MKFKPTLTTLAVAALATSVQAQALTKEFYNVKGALNTTMYNAYTGFLNNYGSGLTSFGNSGTTWALVGGEKDIGANFSVIGNYGVGIAQTSVATT